MKQLILLFALSLPLYASPEILETPHYLISVEDHCPEGSITCTDGVTYIGKNKITGKLIRLKGGTAHTHSPDGTPTHFLGYIFKTGSIVYFVGEDGYIKVTDGEKLLVYENGKWKR